MYWIIDRLEEDYAVCELPGGGTGQLPLGDLPGNVREGDCLRRENGVFVVDTAETGRRRKGNHDLFRSLLKGDSD